MITPIKIIDRAFTFLGEIDDYQSLIWKRNWHKVGDFELHINASKQNADQLQKENIVFLDERKAGVILYREISSENSDSLVIKGISLKGIVGRRITHPPSGQAYDSIEDNAENVIKHFVDMNCVNPENPNRVIADLVIAPSQNRGAVTSYQTRLKNLAEEIGEISLISGLGWDVYLDIQNKQFVFEVYEGRDLTSSQNILPPAIFSLDYDNIATQSFIQSRLNYRNVAYTGGQGTGTSRAISVYGDENTGLDRYEVFIDGSDVADSSGLTEKGMQKLKSYEEALTFDNEIFTRSNLVYEEDFDLGDIITAINQKWGVTLDTRIVEIVEAYEENGFKLEATFGTGVPTLIEKIKQEIDRPLIERPLPEDLGVPTRVSELENDAGYITEDQIPEGAASYTHEQVAPASEWVIVHNLGLYPNVAVVDSGGSLAIGDVSYISENELHVSFTVAFSGTAYLS